VIWYVDSPRVTTPWLEPARIDIRGWLASPDKVESVRFADPASVGDLELRMVARPDVEARYHLPTIGFEAAGPVCWPKDCAVIDVVATTSTEEVVISVPAHDRATSPADARRRKHERLVSILRCPRCHGDLRRRRFRSGATCASCRAGYPARLHAFDFLPAEMQDQHGIVHTDNVSSNAYDGVAWNVVNRTRDGLILDVGAGRRDDYVDNVVYLDVVAYDSTDVLAPAQVLPFRDDAFDVVFSFAVLEHVRDPFACAAEIVRVLKPGGSVYGQVPFLSPVHAYPDHYYNMTTHGLGHLFQGLDVRHVGNFMFGHPIFALSWMLNEYSAGLPPEQRAGFEALSVSELMASGDTYLGAPFVTALSEHARETIACANYIIASKPRS
jgi:SAM-dependent methyltransferase